MASSHLIDAAIYQAIFQETSLALIQHVKDWPVKFERIHRHDTQAARTEYATAFNEALQPFPDGFSSDRPLEDRVAYLSAMVFFHINSRYGDEPEFGEDIKRLSAKAQEITGEPSSYEPRGRSETRSIQPDNFHDDYQQRSEPNAHLALRPSKRARFGRSAAIDLAKRDEIKERSEAFEDFLRIRNHEKSSAKPQLEEYRVSMFDLLNGIVPTSDTDLTQRPIIFEDLDGSGFPSGLTHISPLELTENIVARANKRPFGGDDDLSGLDDIIYRSRVRPSEVPVPSAQKATASPSRVRLVSPVLGGLTGPLSRAARKATTVQGRTSTAAAQSASQSTVQYSATAQATSDTALEPEIQPVLAVQGPASVSAPSGQLVHFSQAAQVPVAAPAQFPPPPSKRPSNHKRYVAPAPYVVHNCLSLTSSNVVFDVPTRIIANQICNMQGWPNLAYFRSCTSCFDARQGLYCDRGGAPDGSCTRCFNAGKSHLCCFLSDAQRHRSGLFGHLVRVPRQAFNVQPFIDPVQYFAHRGGPPGAGPALPAGTPWSANTPIEYGWPGGPPARPEWYPNIH